MYEKKDFYLTESKSNLSIGFSYGATLISTSAIIGFGGLAGWLGYSVFMLPIAMMITIYLATVYIGPKVWELNQNIKAKTFIELISKHYDSTFLRKLLSVIVIVLIPFYCTAVMIGVGKVIESTINVNYIFSLAVFSLIVFVTIFNGGMRAIITNDAIQGAIMLIGALCILIWTFATYIFPVEYLTHLNNAFTFSENKMIGFSKSIGFTGFTDMPDFWSKGWLFEVTLLCLTIPVGLIALPQLQTRYMLVKSKDSFKKLAPYGMIIPFVIIGSFFTAGITANSHYWVEKGLTAVGHAGSIDKIIPVWINEGYPEPLGIILFLTILAAAFTTLNSLMHLLSTTVSNDLFQNEHKGYGIVSMLLVIGFAVLMSIVFEKQPAFISRSTAVYFSIIGGSLLPSLIGLCLGHKDKFIACLSFVSGISISLFWLLFVHFKESKLFTGITLDFGRYNFVEVIVPALISSALMYIVLKKLNG